MYFPLVHRGFDFTMPLLEDLLVSWETMLVFAGALASLTQT